MTDSRSHSDRLQLARLSLDGLSVGDAFGERFFTSNPVLHSLLDARAMPAAPWKWTDDTAMALSIVEVLSEHGRIDVDALATAFASRYVADRYRGYGGGAHDILQAIADGVPWSVAAREAFDGQGSFGNGGAMRSAPIGAYFWDDLNKVVENAAASASPTHAHIDGCAGAVAIAVAAALATRIARDEFSREARAFIETVGALCPDGLTKQGLEAALRFDDRKAIAEVAKKLGNGSCVSAQDTVPLCVWVAAHYLGDYEEALWQTVSCSAIATPHALLLEASW